MERYEMSPEKRGKVFIVNNFPDNIAQVSLTVILVRLGEVR
jgi:hypothetical protein